MRPKSIAAGQDRKIRKMVVFKLRPKTVQPERPTSKLADVVVSPQVERIPIESRLTEKTFVNPSGETYEAERRESDLVERLAEFLRANGHTVCRQQIVPHGEWKPLYTDLYVEDLNLVIEGKGSATRENVRMAIGQLADYSRFFDRPRRAILLPSSPRPDLSALAASQAIVMIWPTDEGSAHRKDPRPRCSPFLSWPASCLKGPSHTRASGLPGRSFPAFSASDHARPTFRRAWREGSGGNGLRPPALRARSSSCRQPCT